jgi:predicted GIY-YIG superfamily endonuclease
MVKISRVGMHWPPVYTPAAITQATPHTSRQTLSHLGAPPLPEAVQAKNGLPCPPMVSSGRFGSPGLKAALSAANPQQTIQMAATRRRQTQRTAARRQWGDTSMRGRRRYPAMFIPLEIRELGNRLRQAYRRAEGSDSRGANYIYLATTRGEASYVGITNNPDARQAQHGERHHLHILNRYQPLTRIEVRAIEQTVIDMTRRSARNQNIAESISSKHDYYRDAMRFGEAFISWITRDYRATIEISV